MLKIICISIMSYFILGMMMAHMSEDETEMWYNFFAGPFVVSVVLAIPILTSIALYELVNILMLLALN